jgi:Flp pilus assembly protein TadB
MLHKCSLDVNPGKQIVELLERVFETYPVSSASFMAISISISKLASLTFDAS